MRTLISTEDTAVLLASGQAIVLDVRWRLGGPPARRDYEAAHLPGAVYLDVDTDLADPPSTALGRHPLPDPERLAATLRAAGIGQRTPVVAYDDADGAVAARAWWLLRWLGHDDAAVLDGGFAAWRAENRPVTTEVPHPEPGDLRARPGRMPVLDADGAAELAARGVLLDARAAGRYRGEVEPVDARAGHVPGARSSPSALHTDETGRWLPARKLAERFHLLGVDDAAEVGAYCGSGVTACSVILALEHAGVATSAALYAGSFSQWSADPRRAVAAG